MKDKPQREKKTSASTIIFYYGLQTENYNNFVTFLWGKGPTPLKPLDPLSLLGANLSA